MSHIRRVLILCLVSIMAIASGLGAIFLSPTLMFEVSSPRSVLAQDRETPQDTGSSTATPTAGGRDTPQDASTPSAEPTSDARDQAQGDQGDITQAGDGATLIAYAGVDGNIWVTRPDGTGQAAITTTGTPEQPFTRPQWSPDGSSLVFQSGFSYQSPALFLYRDGIVASVPGVDGCHTPAFGPDEMLYFACGQNRFGATSPTLEELANAPWSGYVSASRIDGRDWRVVVPYRYDEFPDWGGNYVVDELQVSAGDGTIMTTTVGSMAPSVWMLDPDTAALVERLDPLGNYYTGAVFAPDGERVIATVCEGDCFRSSSNFTESYVLMERDGSAATPLLSLPPDTFSSVAAVAPDLSAVAYSIHVYGASPGNVTSETIYVAALPGGEPVAIARGSDPAWQPVAGALALPDTSADATTRIVVLSCPIEDHPDALMRSDSTSWMIARPAGQLDTFAPCSPSSQQLDGLVLGYPNGDVEFLTIENGEMTIEAPPGRFTLGPVIGPGFAPIAWEGGMADIDIVVLTPDPASFAPETEEDQTEDDDGSTGESPPIVPRSGDEPANSGKADPGAYHRLAVVENSSPVPGGDTPYGSDCGKHDEAMVTSLRGEEPARLLTTAPHDALWYLAARIRPNSDSEAGQAWNVDGSSS